MRNYFPFGLPNDSKIMIFIDGENLAIRFANWKGSEIRNINDQIAFRKNVFAWPTWMNLICQKRHVIRRTLYTSMFGDTDKIIEIEEEIKKSGIECPKVFKRRKERASKQVDISITTDVLSHSFRKNMDVAVIVAGDEDYLPLIEATKMNGCFVIVWFIDEGLSPAVKMAADYYTGLEQIFDATKQEAHWE